MEIERKFLIKDPSFILTNEFKEQISFINKIEQGYIDNNQCMLRYQVVYSIKGPQGLIVIKNNKEELERNEYIHYIDARDALEIIDKYCDKRRITKYRITTKDKWEIDIFDDRPLGLFIAEKELNSVDEELIIPEPISFFIYKEVTAIPYFYNQNIVKGKFFDFRGKRKELARKIIKEIWPYA